VFHNYIAFWFHKTFSFQFFVYVIVQNISKLSIYCAYYCKECISNLFCLYSSCFWELCQLCCMAQLVLNPSKKKTPPVNVGITDMQQKMLSAYFEGCIVSRYGSVVDVPGSGFKYIYCDLIDPFGYLIITLTLGSNFVSTFSFHLNVGSSIWVLNFRVNFKNTFERGDWEFILRVGATTIIEQIDPFLVYLQFVPTHSIWILCKGKIWRS